MRQKYFSKKIDTPDGRFDSKKEYERYKTLRILEQSGEIYNLQRQVEYVLIPKQLSAAGKLLERPCKYLADFTYEIDGETIVEDVKGFRTPEYRIKRKLMLFIHGIRVKEV